MTVINNGQLHQLAVRVTDAVAHQAAHDAPPALLAKAALDEVTAFADLNPGTLPPRAVDVLDALADLLEEW